MTQNRCHRCRLIRVVLASIVLGAGAGFGVLAIGGSVRLSMTATFFGAIGPLLWLARQNRTNVREGQ